MDLNKYCHCGCGVLAPIAKYTSKTYGWIKGQSKRYIHGHRNRGIPRSEETKRKISIANKGQIPWQVGTDRFKGEDNPQWKGDEVGYFALHEWVKNHLVEPLICEHCHEFKRLDLANKSGLYKRDLADWLWLCRKCHIKYDHIIEKRSKTIKERELLCVS